jgi:hypothetical protein
MTKREGGEIAEIKLRCREVLRVQLETEALANNRSVNFGNKPKSAEQTVEDGKPATPVASPTEQAAWAPVMAQEPHPDEKANDRRTAKGKKRKTRAK